MPEKTGPTIGIKVTDALKIFYDELSPERKKHLKCSWIEAIEREIHDSHFRRGMYGGIYSDEEKKEG